MSDAKKKVYPKPSARLLGTGAAAKAGRALQTRRQNIDAIVDGKAANTSRSRPKKR